MSVTVVDELRGNGPAVTFQPYVVLIGNLGCVALPSPRRQQNKMFVEKERWEVTLGLFLLDLWGACQPPRLSWIYVRGGPAPPIWNYVGGGPAPPPPPPHPPTPKTGLNMAQYTANILVSFWTFVIY